MPPGYGPVLLRFGHDPFTTAQAGAAGISRRQLQRLAGSGLLTSPVYGVHHLGNPLDVAGRARAAGLVLPRGGAVARRTAAWLLGVDARGPGRQAPDVECVVPRGRTPVRRHGLRCYQTDLAAEDLTTIDAVPCTTPVRTAADLLRWTPPHMGLAAVDALAAVGIVLPADVGALLERWPGERYVEQARRLAGWIEPRTESFGESWLRLRVLDAGFPRPRAQVAVPGPPGRPPFRLDLGWPELRLGLEYDGEEHHSSLADRRHDEGRRAWLDRERGWTVIGFGKAEVLGPDMSIERGLGEIFGMEPLITYRRW